MRRLIVGGDPVPQGSTKAFAVKGRAFVTQSNAGPLGRYRNDIRQQWAVSPLREQTEGALPVPDFEGPVRLDIAFGFRRPKSHYNAKGNLKGEMYANPAPTHYTSKPDLDKLIRAVGDALTGFAYEDDQQVVTVKATKVYAEQEPFTDITVTEEV